MIHSPYSFPGLFNAKEISANVRKHSPLLLMQHIKYLVIEYYGLKSEYVFTRCRKREYVMARQIMHYLAFKYTSLSYSVIGSMIHRGVAYDHTTIIYSINTIKNLIETNAEFRATMEELEAAIRPGSEIPVRKKKQKTYEIKVLKCANDRTIKREIYVSEHEKIVMKYASTER